MSDYTNPLLANTLWSLLKQRAELTPDLCLLIEGDHRQQRATVADCLRLAEQLAAGLLELGVKPGMVVSWQLPTRLQTLILKLALSRLSVIQNPVLHLFRERELTDILSQTKPELLIVAEADSSCDYPAQAQRVAEKVGAKVLVLGEQWPKGDVANLPPEPSDGDAIRWYYCTSGTTSGPKAVRHTDKTLMAGGLALAVSLEASNKDVTSIAYPVAHIGGAMVLSSLLQIGMTAVLIERFDLSVAAEAFNRHGVTMTGGSTAHYQAWLGMQAAKSSEKVIKKLRMFTGGGASKPPQLYFQAQETMSVPIVHAYGMTESPLVASNTPSSGEHAMAYTDGRPVAGMDVKLKKLDGQWALQGEEGEVLIKGDCLCKGYLDPEQTAEAFDEEGYYHTGDLARFDEAGNISLTGRLKDIIIRKGENISAKEIEEILVDYPGVSAVAVIGLPDEERGERVCAVLETSESDISLKDINQYLSAKGLMKQKLPEQLEQLSRFPRSEALGKISKKDLQKQFLAG